MATIGALSTWLRISIIRNPQSAFHKTLLLLLIPMLFAPACRVKQMPGLPPIEGPDTLAGKFRNPILSSAPDPWVEQKDSFYYLIHTTGENLRLYKTKAMSDVRNATVKTVWTPPGTGPNSKEIWAPEIHYIDGKWYLYYAADNGLNENHRMWVLENSSADPLDGTWTDRGKLNLPDDKWAIDASVFEHAGQLYCIWSGWEGDLNVRQDIYICRLTDPVTPTGPRSRISRPELAWETGTDYPTVNEGPALIKRGTKLFITYSARGCWTDDYSIGLLTADSTADLLNPASWTKSTTPVFTKNTAGQAYAPGHNGFFKSRDGTEDWLIYHANAQPGQGCGDARSARMQRFTWKADGTPDFGKPAPLGIYLDKPAGEK
jgi:GH43 family beta-xylosidase